MAITAQEALTRCIEHREIFHDEMLDLMHQIMSGEMSPVMIAAITIGLRVKKETIGEIAAAAEVMRELATKVGGQGPDQPRRRGRHRRRRRAHLQHLHRGELRRAPRPARAWPSTWAARSPAAPAAADVLESLGANINVKPEDTARAIDELGVGFMFAPAHHSAMKHAAPVRRELGVRTIFNILGPLTNPALAPTTLMGVFHGDLVGIQIRVLQRLGARHALTVWGEENLDEISISGYTQVGELKDGRITEYRVHPEQFGLPVHDPRTLRVATVEESRDMVLKALENKAGAARDIVALNAGAAIYAADKAPSIADGVEMAMESHQERRGARQARRVREVHPVAAQVAWISTPR